MSDTTHDLAPTMLIGLGGSGKDVLLRVRRFFFENYGTKGFPIVGYLVLDTDKDAFEKQEGDTSLSPFVLRNIRFDLGGEIPEGIHCGLTKGQYDSYFRGGRDHHPHIFRWMLPEMQNRYNAKG